MAGLMNAQNRHEEYLIRLGKRNKYLKAKSEAKCENTQTKQYFSVYVNGENKPKTNSSGSKSARGKKYPLKEGFFNTSNVVRSKTAPENKQRKFWGQGTITIKTDKGEKIQLSHKENNCEYSDDFEDINFSSSFNTTKSNTSISSNSSTNSVQQPAMDSHSEESSNMFDDVSLLDDNLLASIVPTANHNSDYTVVKFVLYSSWDGLDEFGLTEIQLYDSNGKKVLINGDVITSSGMCSTDGELLCLVNNKFKTAKERNMVLFKKTKESPAVTLCFRVQCQESLLSKLLVWNYNRSINELGYGVKSCEIYLNEKRVFKGDLEKGCGNQVFDYAHVIHLSQYSNSTKNHADKKSGQISLGLVASASKPDQFIKHKHKFDASKKQNNILEQSWNSLSLFNHTQFGTLLSASRNHNVLESNSNISMKDSNIAIEIPQLPYGKHLSINITSTWGDMHYVGLNGIEFYSETGDLIQITEISADPPDINVLPDVTNDPRVATNLVDGINNTNDDLHMWLAPFTPGTSHAIHIAFEKSMKVAMARIWNYNKSRIHACRGVRNMTIKLDGDLIFNGEIARASGLINRQLETFGDTILFTLDESILEKVAKNDELYSEMDTT